MISLVSLLVALALVSLQTTSAYTHIDTPKIEMDNHLEPENIPSPRRRMLRKNVHIDLPPPKTLKFIPGSVMVIECQAFGHPAPMIGWMRNGIPISDFEEDTNEIMSTNPLSIAQVVSKLVLREPENGDVYTCVAVSDLKKDVASTTVYVEDGELSDLPSMESAKPVITTYYLQILQSMGTSVTLPCSVDSSTPAQIFWLDINNKPIFGNPRMRILPSGALHITDLAWQDMGEYTCAVKNMYGKTTASTFVYPLSH